MKVWNFCATVLSKARRPPASNAHVPRTDEVDQATPGASGLPVPPDHVAAAPVAGEPAELPAPPDFAEELVLWRRARRRSLARTAVVTAVLATVLLGLMRHGEALDAWMRGETDWRGHVVYEPRQPLDRSVLRRMDLARVHAYLIPRWARTSTAATSPHGRWQAQWAFEDLRHAVEADPNLEALVRELDVLLRVDPAGEAVRIDYLLWAWNDYLRSAGEPYRIEASLWVRDGRAHLYPRTYRVLSETTNALGASVRVLRRLDRGSAEPWLGRTAREDEGATIAIDRVLHFAVHEVWPMLDPRLDHLADVRRRSLLPGLRDEVERELGPTVYATLTETAEDVRALLDASASIESRRACGASFRVFEIPYRGLSPRSIYMIELALRASEGSMCPDLTMDEATQIVSASERLSHTGGIEAAMEALTMLVARSVASHELRHVTDGPARTVTCEACDAETPSLVRAELSAYLAAFADERTGFLSAYQACARPETEIGLQTLAAEMAIGAVVPGGCEGEIPTDLHARARSAERRFFGEREISGVPAAFPSELRLFSTRTTGVSLPTASR